MYKELAKTMLKLKLTLMNYSFWILFKTMKMSLNSCISLPSSSKIRSGQPVCTVLVVHLELDRHSAKHQFQCTQRSLRITSDSYETRKTAQPHSWLTGYYLKTVLKIMDIYMIGLTGCDCSWGQANCASISNKSRNIVICFKKINKITNDSQLPTTQLLRFF